MRVRFTIGVDIDEGEAARHVDETGGNEYPLVADPTEWTWDDLVGAIESEIAVNAEVVTVGETPDLGE
jgi:hypothetical protein